MLQNVVKGELVRIYDKAIHNDSSKYITAVISSDMYDFFVFDAIVVEGNEEIRSGITIQVLSYLFENFYDEDNKCKVFYISDWNNRKELINSVLGKISQAKKYYSSSEVDCFFIEGYDNVPFWFNKEERISYRNIIDSAENLQQENIQLEIQKGNSIEVPVEKAKQLLSSLEMYCYQCYLNFNKIIVSFSEKKTKEEVDEIDVTANYPEKLTIKLSE